MESAQATNKQQWVEISIKPGGVAIVSLNREPVNTMNLNVWQQLSDTLDQLEANPHIRAVVFRSALKRDVFTAGNDITELFKPTKEGYRIFWLTSNRFLSKLFASRLITVAAIRGACPAGGCALSLCCDYRIMTDFGHIGLNEVALGISVPRFWAKRMQDVIGIASISEQLLLQAKLISPQQALDIHLVDEVVPAHMLEARALEVVKGMLKMPDGSRSETKRLLRGEFCQEWEAYMEEEAEYAWKLLNSPPVVARIESVLKTLGGGGKKKAKM
jgi:3,2-trans-enoyl-CoA isomerase